ncbi:MAG: divalent-cation tolerance protein CutA [Armatimonadota bacterium]
MAEYVAILVTTPDSEEAESIAHRLLERRLVACANILAGVRSLFWWEDKINTSGEVLLVLKTRRELLDEVTQSVTEAHSYDVCEVIGLPILAGNASYLRWIDQSVWVPRGE